MSIYTATSTHDLPGIAAQLLHEAGPKRIWLFNGEMGAGKTTLIKEVCKQLGVISPLSSPTFSIVNEYATGGTEKVFHFDLYRIKKPSELLDLGFEEYLYSGHYCLVEWPQMADDFFDATCFRISIQTRNEVRQLTTT